MTLRMRIHFALLVGVLSATTALAGPLEDFRSLTNKALSGAVKKAVPGLPADPAASQAHLPNSSSPSNATVNAIAPLSLDGSWYSAPSGIGLSISGGKGTATNADKMGHKPGDAILDIEPKGGNAYAGRMLMEIRRGQLEWTEVKSAIQGGKLGIGLKDGRQYVFERGTAPSIGDPSPSGLRYIVGSCAPGTFAVALFDPGKLDFKRLPAGGRYKFDEAPQPLGKIFAEAQGFVRNVCGENGSRTQFPVFFIKSGPLPPLPLEVRDFDAADAKVYIYYDTGTFSNRVAGQMLEEQQVAARKAARDASAARANAETARRTEFVAKHGAVELNRVGILWTNPFSLEGKTIAVPVEFHQMTSPTDGRFEVLVSNLSDHGGVVVVSDIPRGIFAEPVRGLLVARVVGLRPSRGLEGGEPLLKYVASYVCAEKTLSCP